MTRAPPTGSAAGTCDPTALRAFVVRCRQPPHLHAPVRRTTRLMRGRDRSREISGSEGSVVDVRSNPIVDRAEWERQRARAAEDPGGFHGDIAKSAIHWYDAGREAWITFDDAAGAWTGWTAVDGEAVALDDLAGSHEPWERAFDGGDPPFFAWV